MFEFLHPHREPMSSVDTAWLRMERPTNLMMITAVLFFEGAVSGRRLENTIRERLLKFKRFNQKPVDTATGTAWEFDRDFDLGSHLRRTALPGAAGKAELQQYISELASTPLARGRPLWQFHVVENYAAGSVLIARFHHCYADGLALVQVLLSMTDEAPGGTMRDDAGHGWNNGFGTGPVGRLLAPARRGLSGTVWLGGKALREALTLIRNPQQVASRVREGGELATELALALTLSEDPKTSFKGGRLSTHKKVAWCEPVPLDEIKALAQALGVKVNDLLIAAVTGALRHYLLARGEDVDGLSIRATVPVNLRPVKQARDLGNHFGLVFLELPIGEANPMARLIRVHDTMTRLKSSKQAVVSLGLLAALGMGPSAAQAPALEMLSRKATAVLTNVPGPRRPLYLAGSRVTQQMFWVPQTGNIALGVSILSYDGWVQFGLMTDASRVPDPERIIDRFAPELEQLVLLSLMLPLEGGPRPDLAEALLNRSDPEG